MWQLLNALSTCAEQHSSAKWWPLKKRGQNNSAQPIFNQRSKGLLSSNRHAKTRDDCSMPCLLLLSNISVLNGDHWKTLSKELRGAYLYKAIKRGLLSSNRHAKTHDDCSMTCLLVQSCFDVTFSAASEVVQLPPPTGLVYTYCSRTLIFRIMASVRCLYESLLASRAWLGPWKLGHM